MFVALVGLQTCSCHFWCEILREIQSFRSLMTFFNWNESKLEVFSFFKIIIFGAEKLLSLRNVYFALQEMHCLITEYLTELLFTSFLTSTLCKGHFTYIFRDNKKLPVCEQPPLNLAKIHNYSSSLTLINYITRSAFATTFLTTNLKMLTNLCKK